MSLRLFGKYRGTVCDINDPQERGRIKVSVPAVLPGAEAWALPCVPYAGPDVGLFLIPPVGTAVWVEFEGGDPTLPIWSGCFWQVGELPVSKPDEKVLKTENVTISFESGSEEESLGIKTASGQKITITSDSIAIETNDGSGITLNGRFVGK